VAEQRQDQKNYRIPPSPFAAEQCAKTKYQKNPDGVISAYRCILVYYKVAKNKQQFLKFLKWRKPQKDISSP
jgi:hypothetical protein